MKRYRNHPTAPPTASDTKPLSGEVHPPEAFCSEALWADENFKKFTLLARRRVATLPWYGRFNGRPPAGMEPADYVLKAAELLMSGTRRCRVEYSLETCVQGVIESLISHHSDDAENSIGHDYLFMENDGEKADGSPPATGPSIEETIVALDQLEKYKARFTEEKQRRYIDLIASGGCDSAADAAAALGLRESDVRNIVKVIRRKRDQWPGKPRPEGE